MDRPNLTGYKGWNKALIEAYWSLWLLLQMNGEKPVTVQFNLGHIGDFLIGIERRLPHGAMKKIEEAQKEWVVNNSVS